MKKFKMLWSYKRDQDIEVYMGLSRVKKTIYSENGIKENYKIM